MAVIVAGRLASVEGIAKILLSTHTMLGAPKIETDGGQNPMEKMEAFLTGASGSYLDLNTNSEGQVSPNGETEEEN